MVGEHRIASRIALIGFYSQLPIPNGMSKSVMAGMICRLPVPLTSSRDPRVFSTLHPRISGMSKSAMAGMIFSSTCTSDMFLRSSSVLYPMRQQAS